MSNQLSKQGAAFIAHFEGIFLYAYPDPGTGGEPWTIGIGSTHFDGMGRVRKGDRITLERAIVRFRKTMEKRYVVDVLAAIRRGLSRHELDALASFHYNTGAIRKGSVDDKFNRGDDRSGLATWAAYKKAGGRVMAGLERRRAAEIHLWRTGSYAKAGRIMVRDNSNGGARYIDPVNIPWDIPEPPALVIELDFPEPTKTAPPLPEKRPRDNFILSWLKQIWSFFNA